MFYNQRFKMLLSNRQNLYITLRNSDLFHNVCNVKKKNEIKDEITTFPWSSYLSLVIPTQFDT